MIGRRGERGSGISVLAAQYDDDGVHLFILLCLIYYFLLFLSCTSLRGPSGNESLPLDFQIRRQVLPCKTIPCSLTLQIPILLFF